MNRPQQKLSQAFLLGALVASSIGCAPSSVEPLPDLVVVKRDVADAGSAGSFALGLKRDQLAKRYFFTAYLTQVYPRAETGFYTLGTRVVSFESQNDKLLVFDVDARKKASSVADPQVLVEAYPVIDAPESLPNAKDYVVIDPSAGLNRFNLVSDNFSRWYDLGRFEIDVSSTQNFKTLSDGVSFEQVFSGSGLAASAANTGALEYNPYRLSGTARVTLRAYVEGQGYLPSGLPDRPYYFTSDVRLVPNEARSEVNPVKWNLTPSTRITWKIDRALTELQADPRFASVRLLRAMKAGVENWNAAFGRPVLSAELAAVGDSSGDDDTNFLVIDRDAEFGYAFADWRSNPNTGEIRGASVYFSSSFLEFGDAVFETDPAQFVAKLERLRSLAKPVRAFSLGWSGLPSHRACDLDLGALVEGLARRGPASAPSGAGRRTKSEKIEAYVTFVVMHEIGHTLGLRHNFQGSLLPVSSSVMEYVVEDQAIELAGPQAYDRDAVRWLYRLSRDLPAQPFCTDEDTEFDPLCTRFDATASPLEAWDGAYYALDAEGFALGLGPEPEGTLNAMLKWVRVGTPEQQAQAWDLVVAPALTPPLGAQPQNVDAMVGKIFRRLYLDEADARGRFTANPPPQPFVTNQARLELVNEARSFETRRVMIDVLKAQQTLAAYQALLWAKAAITGARAGMTGTQADLSDDLLARVTAAMSPYFLK